MESMTGYGHAEWSGPQFALSLDVRTLNSRYLDFNLRLPRELLPFEQEARSCVKKSIARGRVELTATLHLTVEGQVYLNEPLVRNLRAVEQAMCAQGVPGVLEVRDLVSISGVLLNRDTIPEGVNLQLVFLKTLDEALTQVRSLRSAEGVQIRSDLIGRLSRLRGQVESIQELCRKSRATIEEKLKQRVAELPAVDEGRMAQEILYYLEKSDVTEELVRLTSHLDRFESSLEGMEVGGRAAIGRKLDFLCQEMNREVTTVLSKSAMAEISGVALDAKTEVERVREQVQNVQ